jgi:hypothetical protein
VRHVHSGRVQRAASWLLRRSPAITTQQIVWAAYRGTGTRDQRKKRAWCARRACVTLGLVRVARLWPGGNVYARKGREIEARNALALTGTAKAKKRPRKESPARYPT